jgi:hypothetical protein
MGSSTLTEKLRSDVLFQAGECAGKSCLVDPKKRMAPKTGAITRKCDFALIASRQKMRMKGFRQNATPGC